jgi:hypothetical protein
MQQASPTFPMPKSAPNTHVTGFAGAFRQNLYQERTYFWRSACVFGQQKSRSLSQYE